MIPAEALQTAARRYCRAKHDDYWETHKALGIRLYREGRGLWKTNTPTAEELAIYPRYIVLTAILYEIEKILPDVAASVDGMRERLIEIGRDARDDFTDNPANLSGRRAMDDERERFIDFVRSISLRKLTSVKRLPFRRILSHDESRQLWHDVKAIWRIDGHWYPLAKVDSCEDMVAFHTDYFDPKMYLLREILRKRSVERVWEIRWSMTSEIELDSFSPYYDQSGGSTKLYGANEEAYWTSGDLQWLVYASHENSITLAGKWLVAAFEDAVPGCRAFTYPGHDSSR